MTSSSSVPPKALHSLLKEDSHFLNLLQGQPDTSLLQHNSLCFLLHSSYAQLYESLTTFSKTDKVGESLSFHHSLHDCLVVRYKKRRKKDWKRFKIVSIDFPRSKSHILMVMMWLWDFCHYTVHFVFQPNIFYAFTCGWTSTSWLQRGMTNTHYFCEIFNSSINQY